MSLRWDLVDPASPPTVRHDSREWLAVTLVSPLVGSCFIASVHLNPSTSWPQKRASLKAMAALAKHFKPQLTLLLGDFNCTATNGSPLD